MATYLSHHCILARANLPEYATVAEKKPANKYKEPPHDIKLALANLARLGCIKMPATWSGLGSELTIFQTALRTEHKAYLH